MPCCAWWKTPPKEDEVELGLISGNPSKKFSASTSCRVIVCVMLVFLICDMFLQMALVAGAQKVDQTKMVGGFTLYDTVFRSLFPREREQVEFAGQVTFRITRVIWDFYLILLPYLRVTAPNLIRSTNQATRGIAALIGCTLLFIIMTFQWFTMDVATFKFLALTAPIEYFFVMAYITFVFKTDFVEYDPFLFHSDYHRSCLIESRSDLGIIVSKPYEIELRNYMNKPYKADGHERIERRVIFDGKYSNQKIAFYLPKGMTIGAGDTVKLIPETEPSQEEDTVPIKGFRCFGFSTGREIRTELTNILGENMAQKRELNRLARQGRYRTRKTLKTSRIIWDLTKFTTFDLNGDVHEIKRVSFPYPPGRFREERNCTVKWKKSELNMLITTPAT